jgi:glycosyltransferase involved in cell wall biosynthesis
VASASALLTVEAQRAAFEQRMRVVAGALQVTVSEEASAGTLLDAVARRVRDSDDTSELWLLHIGITGIFPGTLQLDALRRRLALSTPATAMLQALESTIDVQSRTHSGLRTIELLSDTVLVDVDFCARFEHNTGIQRVVRHTVPHWQDTPGRDHRLVAWTQDSTGYRDLTDRELDRVLHWSDRRLEPGADELLTDLQLESSHVLVPWRSTLVIAEVPSFHLLDNLTCIAESSGNKVTMIGYDAIPLVSADTLPNHESERFAHYLTLVKHSTKIIGISRSAADEFQGFVDALPSQGLVGPEVTAVLLATEVSEAAKAAVAESPASSSDEPLILCVGSHEPRKNQDAVLFAAEVLFREGRNFRLVFVGGGSRQATLHFDQRVAELRKAGMNVESHRGMGDADLWRLFAEARFTVFVSLHEGFGLPVAESLALGAPVLTSNFGSLNEVAIQGGCVQIDPRDDEQIIDGMRSLLTDDALLASLREQIAHQTQKTWASYSDELWIDAVEGVRR